MKITAFLCFFLYVPAFVHVGIAPAMTPSEADESVASQSAAFKQPTTMPWSLTLPSDNLEVLPINRAETVEDALAYSDDEKIILDDVRDGDGQLSRPALYIMLRRARMLPGVDKTLEEAERPNPKDFWREPERYRGRLVRVKVRYGGRTTAWTENVTPTRWWGRRDVWMVDVLVESEKTKPPTYRRVLAVMGHEPPKNLLDRQPLELVGIFYKLARLREDAEEGDPDIMNEYPVIVAGALFAAPSPGENGFQWGAVLMIVAAMVMLFVFMLLRRSVSRRRAAGRREYPPMRPDDSAGGAEAGPMEEVNEELRRQVESYQAERRGKNAGNT
ncbi:MAG: hypothetical protein SVV80_06590 [Planctomycetota bacterium]|nr:hypothetical protein [Planctomycetota bacterium]